MRDRNMIYRAMAYGCKTVAEFAGYTRGVR